DSLLVLFLLARAHQRPPVLNERIPGRRAAERRPEFGPGGIRVIRHSSFVVQERGEGVAPLEPLSGKRDLVALRRGLTARGCEEQEFELRAELLIPGAVAVGERLVDLAVKGV